ncbi:phage terminase small subunit P27 family [Saccharopolyspora sp. NPDC002376]
MLHGDRKDRINDAEPIPPEGEVTPLEDLSEDARAAWDRLAPSLITVGVLTSWDVDAFVVVCEALARYKQATKLVNGSALLVQDPNGFVENPALTVQHEAETMFAQYGARFVLTPSDRTQLKVDMGGAAKGPTRCRAPALLSCPSAGSPSAARPAASAAITSATRGRRTRWRSAPSCACTPRTSGRGDRSFSPIGSAATS